MASGGLLKAVLWQGLTPPFFIASAEQVTSNASDSESSYRKYGFTLTFGWQLRGRASFNRVPSGSLPGAISLRRFWARPAELWGLR